MWQKFISEAVATFALVFVGAGAVLANEVSGDGFGFLGVALAHGLVLLAMTYAVYHLSGAHINPAVTIALWATGKVKTGVGFGYIVAQLVGSVVAALLLKVVFPGIAMEGFLGDTSLAPGVTPGAGILVEAILTFFLVFAVFGTIVDKRGSAHHAGLVLGATLALGNLLGGPLTGGALNPARSFGPAFLSNHWMLHYVYWVGPVLGGLVAAFVYYFSFLGKVRAAAK